MIGSLNHAHSKEFSSLLRQATTEFDQTEHIADLACYRLHETIADRGTPLKPGGIPFDGGDDLLQPHCFPFGIVVQNAATVAIPSGSNQTHHHDIKVVLGPGETIGLFELFEGAAHSASRPVQPWTIFSGSKNIHPLCDAQSKGRCNGLKKRYGDNDVDTAFFTKNNKPLFESLEMFKEWTRIRDSWSCNVIYFRASFLTRLGLGMEISNLSEVAAKLRLKLASYAAHRLAISENYFSGFWRTALGDLFGARNSVVRSRRQAFDVWTRILTSVHGQKFSYEIREKDYEIFPAAELCEFLATDDEGKKFTKPAPVLAPFVGGSGPRYLPIVEVLEGVIESEFSGVMEQIVNMYNDPGFQHAQEQIAVPKAAFFSALKIRKNAKPSEYYGYQIDKSGRPRQVDIEFKDFVDRKHWITDNDKKDGALKFSKYTRNIIRIDLDVFAGEGEQRGEGG